MPPVVTHISNVHRWNDARIYRREILSLVETGFNVNWIVPVSSGETPQPAAGVNLIPLPTNQRLSRMTRLKTIVEVVGSVASDIVHAHDPELLLVASALKHVSGAAFVYDKHEYYRGRRGLKARTTRIGEILLAKDVDALIVVADDASGLPDVDDLLLPDIPVVTLPNYPQLGGIASSPSDRKPNTGLDPELPLRLVYTGVAGWERGLWLMLDLLEELLQRGRTVELTICGVCYRSSERQRFVESLRARGLAEAVRLEGWSDYLPWEKIYSALKDADVGLMLMHPDYRSWSNVPTKFYEYMSAGLPFVCTNYESWTQFADASGAGRSVDPRSVHGCADTVCAVVDRAEAWAELSRAGRAASARYTWQQVAPRLPELYSRIVM